MDAWLVDDVVVLDEPFELEDALVLEDVKLAELDVEGELEAPEPRVVDVLLPLVAEV